MHSNDKLKIYTTKLLRLNHIDGSFLVHSHREEACNNYRLAPILVCCISPKGCCQGSSNHKSCSWIHKIVSYFCQNVDWKYLTSTKIEFQLKSYKLC
jgi:hypothetical protein